MKKNFEFKNSYGDTLKGHYWSCENFEKIIIIVTGMQEHSSRYNEFALKMNENKYQVYCLDHYGQGENVTDNKSYGIVVKDYFNKMSDTVFEFYNYLFNEFKKPVYIVAHSMGSFIMQNMIQRHKFSTSKLVLIGTSGPMVGSKVGYLLAKCIVNDKNFNKPAKLLKKLTIGSYEKKVKDKDHKSGWISYNRDNLNKYINDEKCMYDCSNGFYLYLIKGLSKLFKKKNIKNIDTNLDILVLVGKDDPVSNFSKTVKKLEKLYKKCNHENISIKIYEDARHEILNEDIKQNVINDILKFLNK